MFKAIVLIILFFAEAHILIVGLAAVDLVQDYCVLTNDTRRSLDTNAFILVFHQKNTQLELLSTMPSARVYVGVGILIVICFIAGINVGLHGASFGTPAAAKDSHLWVKIPDPTGIEDPVTHKPPSIEVAQTIYAAESNSESTAQPVDSSRAPVVRVNVPRVTALPPFPVQPKEPVSVTVHENPPSVPHVPVETVKDSPHRDIMSMVESHEGALEMQLRQLIAREQKVVESLDLDHKPITTYLEHKKKIPVIILTCNRLELLEATVQNLLKVRGISPSDVAILQDGALEGVTRIGQKYGLRVKQNTLGLNLRGGAMSDGGSRIATHYKFSLSQAFDELFPDAPAMIIVEDDLLFSPDFYEYFNGLAPILEADRSLLCISAWNDNGLKGKVRNKYALKRTEFFPGLGWLVSRRLYKGELEAKWPTNHWDHWLRSPTIHKGRDIVFPEVPRTFHNGIKGTFMNMDTHNKYFRDIDYNTDETVRWDRPALDQQLQLAHHTNIDYDPAYLLGTKDVYLMTRMQRFDQCNHVANAGELMPKLLSDGPSVLCIWITAHPDNNPEFAAISSFFKIWHEYKRGSYQGVHEFYFLNHYVMLINTLIKGGVQGKQPASVSVLSSRTFNSRDLQQRLSGSTKGESGLVHVKGATAGASCDEVC